MKYLERMLDYLDVFLRDYLIPVVGLFVFGLFAYLSLGFFILTFYPDIPPWGVVLIIHSILILIIVLQLWDESDPRR